MEVSSKAIKPLGPVLYNTASRYKFRDRLNPPILLTKFISNFAVNVRSIFSNNISLVITYLLRFHDTPDPEDIKFVKATV